MPKKKKKISQTCKVYYTTICRCVRFLYPLTQLSLCLVVVLIKKEEKKKIVEDDEKKSHDIQVRKLNKSYYWIFFCCCQILFNLCYCYIPISFCVRIRSNVRLELKFFAFLQRTINVTNVIDMNAYCQEFWKAIYCEKFIVIFQTKCAVLIL